MSTPIAFWHADLIHHEFVDLDLGDACAGHYVVSWNQKEKKQL